MTEPPIKIMMTRGLETIDQIYSSVRSMIVNSVTLDIGRSSKREPFPEP